MPFFRSLVEMAMATSRGPIGSAGVGSVQDRVLRCVGEGAAPVVGDDDGVLDADAAVLGKVDARLDGDDVAGGERSSRTCAATRGPRGSRGRRRGRCRGGRRRPSRPPSMTLAAGRVDVRPPTPGRHRGARRRPGLGDDVEHPLLGRRRLADARPCGSCRSSSRRRWRRSRGPRGRPRRCAARPGGGGAWRRWGPRRRSSRTRCPRRRAGASRCRARGRTRPRSARRPAAARTRPSAASAMRAAASMRATSPASFTRRRPSTRPSVGTSSASGNQLGGVAALLRPR